MIESCIEESNTYRRMEAVGAGLLLTDLPVPLLERVLLLLDKRTVCSLAACSARMRAIAWDDDLWRQLCERTFPHTNPQCWLALEKSAELSRRCSLDGLTPPYNYRCWLCAAVFSFEFCICTTV